VIKAHGECVKHIYVIDVDSVDDTDDNKLWFPVLQSLLVSGYEQDGAGF
jgi:hypothetical protein